MNGEKGAHIYRPHEDWYSMLFTAMGLQTPRNTPAAPNGLHHHWVSIYSFLYSFISIGPWQLNGKHQSLNKFTIGGVQ